VNAAAGILRDNGVGFEWSAKGRREAAYANLHPDAVDERGHPRADFRVGAYSGAVNAFSEGKSQEGHRRLGGFLRNLRRLPDEVQRSQELADLEFDGEQLWEAGQPEAATAILQAVARWKTDSDLETPIVW